MDPKGQGDALAKRRREQNRLAQRRFRWKQSQNKATVREQERQQKKKSTSGQQVELNSPLVGAHHQPRSLRPNSTTHPTEPLDLVTPSPSSSNVTADHILSLGFFPQFLVENHGDNNDIVRPLPESPWPSSTQGTNQRASRTERARSLASGMGGLLGDLGTSWDYGDTDAFSKSPPPPPAPHQLTSHEGYPGDEQMTPSFMFPPDSAVDGVDSLPLPDTPTSARRSMSVSSPSYHEGFINNYPMFVPVGVDSIGSSIERESWNPHTQQHEQPVPTVLFDDGMARMGTNTARPIRDGSPTETRKHKKSHRAPSSSSRRYQQNNHHYSTTHETNGCSTYQEVQDSASDSDGWLSPLHLAASKGHDRIVRMLLQKHHLQPVINEPDSSGQTALIHAVQGGFEDVVLTLLNAGATVDGVRDMHGQAALHWAVLKRRRTILRHLLDKGNQNKRNGNGQHRESDKRTVMDVDVYDCEGLTPLHRAIDSGFEAGVELLLEFGANLASKIRATPQNAPTGLKEKYRGGNRSRT